MRKTLKNKRMKPRGRQTLRKKDSLANFVKLAEKYKLVQSGSKKQTIPLSEFNRTSFDVMVFWNHCNAAFVHHC